MPAGLDDTHPVFQLRWIHAFEEDSAEGDVYRPETETIPLSRRPRQRHRPVQRDNRRSRMPCELVVEGGDLGPVGHFVGV